MLRPHRERPVTELAYSVHVTLGLRGSRVGCYKEAFVLCGMEGGAPPAQMSMDRGRSCSNALLYIKWLAVGPHRATVRVFLPERRAI